MRLSPTNVKHSGSLFVLRHVLPGFPVGRDAGVAGHGMMRFLCACESNSPILYPCQTPGSILSNNLSRLPIVCLPGYRIQARRLSPCRLLESVRHRSSPLLLGESLAPALDTTTGL